MIKTRYNEKVDEYINNYPEHIARILNSVRELVLSSNDNIIETIKYNMPTYVLKKNIFHFAAHKNHLGIYPSPEPVIFFKDKLAKYKTSKGAIQFQYNEEIPYDLILEIVIYQVNKYL